ncbi:MAG: DUF6688 family protein, partial [Planctomycetota bacterium]
DQRPPDLPPEDAPTTGGVPAWFWKLWYVLAGIILPLACFSLNFVIIGLPEWQSGQLEDFAMIFLGGQVAFVFYPLLLLAMVAMVFLVRDFDRFSRRAWVRTGVYSGIMLSLMYAVAIFVFWGEVFPSYGMASAISLGIIGVPLGVRWFILWMERTNRHDVRWALAPSVLFPPLLFFSVVAVVEYKAVVVFAILGTLSAGPFWALLAYSVMSVRLLKAGRGEGGWKPKAAMAAGWFAAYGAAWYEAFHRAVVVYCSLPTDPPKCYIAAAAARGHAGVVGSERVRLIGGGEMAVNHQLRWLKLAEIALRALAPRLHRACRGLYDIFGPELAREIRSPVTADLAYLALKPVEWAARAALGVVVPDADALARRLYT